MVYRHPEDGGVLLKHVGENKELYCYVRMYDVRLLVAQMGNLVTVHRLNNINLLAPELFF